MSNSLRVNTARDYRSRYPDWASKKLARVMYAENNLLFKDEEDARHTLRYIEGKVGASHRKSVEKTEFVKDEPRPYNPYKLPDSDEENLPPYVVSGYKRALVINDVHLPYHSIEAITTCFDFAKKQKPDIVILNGDIIDFYGLSRFQKDPRKRSFSSELSQFKDFFQSVQKTFKCKVIFKIGNHELRYEHFLQQKAGELMGVDEFEFFNIIKARAEGIEVIKDKTIIKVNDLNLLHGHEFGHGFFNPVNVARGLYLRAKTSAMQGHSHKTAEHTEVDLEGKIKTTWGVGCLASLTPEYLPYNSWNHGFAIIDIADNKVDFDVRNYRIYRGKVL